MEPLHTIRTAMVLALLSALAPAGLAARDSQPASQASVQSAGTEDWDAIAAEAAETEAWMQALEEEWAALNSPVSRMIAGASLATGIGYSDNFYRRTRAAAAHYLFLSADAFFYFPSRHGIWEGFLFSEHKIFYYDDDRIGDGLNFGQVSLTRRIGAFEYGLRGQVYAGDQLYDASLAWTGAPATDRIRQIRPSGSLFLRGDMGKFGQLTLTPGFRRTYYGDPQDDYERLSAKVEWQVNPLPELRLILRAEPFRDNYDERLPRRANSMLIAGDALEVDGLTFSFNARWKPAFLPKLSLTAEAGQHREREEIGAYHDLDRQWLSIRMEYRFLDRWRMELQASRYEIDYLERQVSLFDVRPQQQTFDTLSAELEFELKAGFSLILNVTWEQNVALVNEDNYRQRALHLALRWTY